MNHPAHPQALAEPMRSYSVMGQPVGPAAGALAGGQAERVDLREYAHTLLEQRWLVGAIVAAVTLVAVAYALVATPVYEANMMLHVEEESPNASKNILSEVSSLFETKKAAIAEVELLRSRMVVARAVDNLRLYIEVQPRTFPLAGPWLAARAGSTLSTPGLFGHGGYVWGGEQLEVSQFDVPEALQGRQFVVTAGTPGQFVLSEAGRRLAFAGVIGKTLSAQLPDGKIVFRVERMAALPGAQFLLRRDSRLHAIETIQGALMISEQGKQSGIIEVKLSGTNPALVNQTLAEIGREYMRQNLARKTEEAEKSLAFLNKQLPELKIQLEKAEANYNSFRNSHGTINLDEEVRISLQRSAAAKARRSDLLQKRAEALARYTVEHPLLVALDQQLRQAELEIRETDEHIKTLPLLEQAEARLTREVKVNTDLYTSLSNMAQQLRIVSVGRVSNVRLVDPSVAPERPIRPNRPLVIALAALTGLFLGVLAAFGRKAVQGGIDEPARIERLLGARVVYASVPHSNTQDRLGRQQGGRRLPLLARVAPEDAAVESLRAFRAALQFALPHLRNNIVTITGPTHGVGKSFVAANLGALLAASGKRVLLIDADLRHGQLHRFFACAPENGLAEAVAGALACEQAIRPDVIEGLDFMPTGGQPAQRADFLMHANFGALLAAVSAKYDVVLLDSPPILAVADSLIIAGHAGAAFILARAGVTTEADISESIKRLNHAGISPQGILFNDLAIRRVGYSQPDASDKLGRIAYAA